MNAQEMAIEVKQNLELTKKLKDELYYAKKAIEDSYNEKIRVPKNFIYNLENEYKELAWDLAIEADECPRARWGGPLEPDEVSATDEGIVLTWEDEHLYHASSYHYYTATWEDLINKQKENGEQNDTE